MTDAWGLANKVALVTGSTRGIGKACAQLLAHHGARVAVVGRSDLQASVAVADEIANASGSEVRAYVANASDSGEISSLYRSIKRDFGQLDVLVNNAGVLQDALLGMITREMIDEVFEVNAIAPILHTQNAVKLMRKNGGSIINISSIIGRVGNPGQSVYASSKAALIGLTLASAKELASKQIRVNAVAPGFIDTDMARSIGPEKFAERVNSVAMGRAGTPDEVAGTVLYLASDLSRYVTGQTIGVDGGMLI